MLQRSIGFLNLFYSFRKSRINAGSAPCADTRNLVHNLLCICGFLQRNCPAVTIIKGKNTHIINFTERIQRIHRCLLCDFHTGDAPLSGGRRTHTAGMVNHHDHGKFGNLLFSFQIHADRKNLFQRCIPVITQSKTVSAPNGNHAAGIILHISLQIFHKTFSQVICINIHQNNGLIQRHIGNLSGYTRRCNHLIIVITCFQDFNKFLTFIFLSFYHQKLRTCLHCGKRTVRVIYRNRIFLCFHRNTITFQTSFQSLIRKYQLIISFLQDYILLTF